MAEITASMVKDLRTKSGAGMMDCKKALAETGGDVDAAVDWLRKNGLAAAQKKSGRVAAEGLIAVSVGGNAGAMVEVNSETDFVARNDTFKSFAKTVSDLALSNDGSLETVLASGYPGTERTVEEQLTENIATIGENMSVRRAMSLSVANGVIASYVHNAVDTDLGKIGVLVALESDGDAAAVEAIGKQVAMHIAATAPAALNVDSLDPELVQRERDILIDQARQSGKPEEIIEKMIEGRMRKFYQEVVLEQQAFVIDPDVTVEAAVANAAKEMGGDIKLVGYVRYALGEGIEKKEENFAAEVAAAAGQ